MYTIGEYWNLCDTWYSSEIFIIVQDFFFSEFGTNVLKYILENI